MKQARAYGVGIVLATQDPMEGMTGPRDDRQPDTSAGTVLAAWWPLKSRLACA
jgi:hypothetical protein